MGCAFAAAAPASHATHYRINALVKHSRQLSVPNTHPTRSRYESVLVDQAAEDLVPSWLYGVGLVDRIWSGSGCPGCRLVQDPMRAVLVVVREVEGCKHTIRVLTSGVADLQRPPRGSFWHHASVLKPL
jgi:hypothetical protein